MIKGKTHEWSEEMSIYLINLRTDTELHRLTINYASHPLAFFLLFLLSGFGLQNIRQPTWGFEFHVVVDHVFDRIVLTCKAKTLPEDVSMSHKQTAINSSIFYNVYNDSCSECSSRWTNLLTLYANNDPFYLHFQSMTTALSSKMGFGF